GGENDKPRRLLHVEELMFKRMTKLAGEGHVLILLDRRTIEQEHVVMGVQRHRQTEQSQDDQAGTDAHDSLRFHVRAIIRILESSYQSFLYLRPRAVEVDVPPLAFLLLPDARLQGCHRGWLSIGPQPLYETGV